MNELKIGKLVTLGGAGITFLFSFLPWVSYSGYGASLSRSAWSSGLFPMATWAPICALVVGFLAAVEQFKFLNLPAKIWEFTVAQIIVILSVFSLIITLSYLMLDKGGAGMGFGLILCFLGSVAMLGGFVMDKLNIGTSATGATFQPPVGFPPPDQTGYAQPQQPQFQPPQQPGAQPPAQGMQDFPGTQDPQGPSAF